MISAAVARTKNIYNPPALLSQKQPTESSSALEKAERTVLAQERALVSGSGARAVTSYTYEVGPDGKSYIVGASVTLIGEKKELDRVSGGTPAVKSGMQPEMQPEESEQLDEQDNPSLKRAVAELEQIEREVIAHEAAHMAAAGRFGGCVNYTYTTGPDGKRYITGGSVPISTPPTSDPEEALANAQQVMKAATAPGDPSGQDLAVAARAASAAAAARSKMLRHGDKAISAYHAIDRAAREPIKAQSRLQWSM